MTDEEVKAYIEMAVQRTVRELKKSGRMKQDDDAVYDDMKEILADYYSKGKTDAKITYAIYGKRFDPYYSIIIDYYEKGLTLAAIAEKMGVDVSTVGRNKRRLCLEIYNEII